MKTNQVLLIAAMVIILASSNVLAQAPIPSAPTTQRLIEERWNELSPDERGSVSVYERCRRSVVNIDTVSTMTMFMLGEREIPGGGSGFVLDQQGHILTNFHVIEDVDTAQVTLFTGEAFPAKLVGVDPLTDIAVLKIAAPPEVLFPVTFGDSSRLIVGQRIFAIGNPFGLESTLTSGILSSLNRKFSGRTKSRPIMGAIQIDAAINPGSSGGPLLDTQGRVIGVNTAIASRVGENSGVGFAIPVNTLKRIVPMILRDGKVTRPDIGITSVLETDKGLRIIETVPGGAAAQAGLQGIAVKKVTERRGVLAYTRTVIDQDAADIVAAINGAPVTKGDEFLTRVEEFQPGDRITLTILRGEQTVQVPVVLQKSK